MSYQTGQFYNFENRLHQSPASTADLTLYRLESGDYAAATGLLKRWDKEFVKKEQILIDEG